MAARSPQQFAEAAGHPFTDGAAHMWLGLSREPAERDELELLSASERHRVRVLRGDASISYATAHSALRRILGGYLDADPAEIRLGRTLCPECADPSHGPPAVVWPPTGLRFNLSRTDGSWLLAVTEGRPVGADLETDPHIDPLETAALVCTEREHRLLRSLAGPDQQRDAFLRCWTRKEAVVKAVGVGLIADLSAIDVFPELPGPVIVDYGIAPGPDSWRLEEADFGPGFHTVLARTRDSTGPVRTFRYGTDPLPAAMAAAAGEQ